MLNNNYKLYLSESFDPKFNLSVEEWLMDCSEINDVVLFLWQNENTIVIGRNQNPYKECDVKRLEEDRVQLVRRLSGGGAVYHDLGNLNFTFIASDGNYNLESNMSIILDAVSQFGINGHFNGRNDLLADERKFSGNAFVSDKGFNCHHGTLLVDVDLDKLSEYLTVSPLKLQSKGIDSVSSRVVNLKELSPQITIGHLKDALIKCFNKFYQAKAQPIILKENIIDVAAYIKKYSSWKWNYSESPDFTISVEDRFDWGIIEINLDVSDGVIQNCKVFTDAVIAVDFKSLEEGFKQKSFKESSLLEGIENTIINEQIKKDLYSLVRKFRG